MHGERHLGYRARARLPVRVPTTDGSVVGAAQAISPDNRGGVVHQNSTKHYQPMDFDTKTVEHI